MASDGPADTACEANDGALPVADGRNSVECAGHSGPVVAAKFPQGLLGGRQVAPLDLRADVTWRRGVRRRDLVFSVKTSAKPLGSLHDERVNSQIWLPCSAIGMCDPTNGVPEYLLHAARIKDNGHKLGEIRLGQVVLKSTSKSLRISAPLWPRNLASGLLPRSSMTCKMRHCYSGELLSLFAASAKSCVCFIPQDDQVASSYPSVASCV